MTLRFLLVLTIALGFGFAANSAVAQDDAMPADWPDWLKEAMAKEYKRARYKKFSVGPIKGVLPGKVTDSEAVDDTSFYVAAKDGSDALFECWIWTDSVDMAATTSNIADAIIEHTSSQFGPVNTRFIRAIDAGSLDGAPFLALEWIYTVGEEGNARVAYTKVRTAEKDGAVITCGHNTPGYRKSFESAFARVVNDLKVDVDAPEPYYKELVVQSLNGINIGVTSMQFIEDDDGDTEINVDESSLAPVSETELRVSDTSSISWSTPGGRLINKEYATAENDQMIADLSLAQNENGNWYVAGSFNGKPISADLGSEFTPATELGYIYNIRSLFADENASAVTLIDWVPTVDPTRFLDVELGLTAGSGDPRNGRMTVGPLSVDSVFDSSGSLARGEINLGGAKLLVERVYQQGEAVR